MRAGLQKPLGILEREVPQGRPCPAHLAEEADKSHTRQV
jgi:hypothetical protein